MMRFRRRKSRYVTLTGFTDGKRRGGAPAGRALVVLMTAMTLLALYGTPAVAGFQVSDGKLLDGNGNQFVMRGVNHPHVWYTYRTAQAIEDIASVGANTVRVVLGNGQQWGPTSATEVAEVIRQIKARNMIAVLEVHDVTGYGEKQEAAHLSTATDYWISIRQALVGQEDYVIINIGNEPLGNNVAQTMWAEIHIDAITALREAGLTHTLMVDAANWGQDWEQIMLSDAPAVFAADPLENVVFSVHMYQVYGQRSTIDNYMDTFVNQHRLPLVVGEFGADHQGQDVDEASILELADQYDIGYMGWSWSGNSGGVESLDITYNFDVGNLSPWGDFLINSNYGIRNTSRIATVFANDGDTDSDTDNGVEWDGDAAIGDDGSGNGDAVDDGVDDVTDNGNDNDVDTSDDIDNGSEGGIDDGTGENENSAADNNGGEGADTGTCRVEYITNEWNTGFTAEVRVTNNSSQDIRGWTLTWTFNNSQQVTGCWNADVVQSGNQVGAGNQDEHWNGAISANGGTAHFGFQANHAGQNNTPVDFKLNGTPCGAGAMPDDNGDSDDGKDDGNGGTEDGTGIDDGSADTGDDDGAADDDGVVYTDGVSSSGVTDPNDRNKKFDNM